MNFAEIIDKLKVNDEYSIQVAKGDYLAINVPVLYGSSAAKFDHANIKAMKREVFEFKHYRKNGSKFYTEKPGFSYLFLVPKENIELNTEKSGYSYVYVIIGGQEYCLSVSGGTSEDGWTDWVFQGCSALVQSSIKKIKPIADAATYDGIIDINSTYIPNEDEQNRFRRLCAYHDTRKKLKKGDKIFLWHCEYKGKKGPFDIIEKPWKKRYFRCADGLYSSVRVKYSQIDWVKTAERNNVNLV